MNGIGRMPANRSRQSRVRIGEVVTSPPSSVDVVRALMPGRAVPTPFRDDQYMFTE